MIRGTGNWELGTLTQDPGAGGTLGRNPRYLPLKKLSKNPLDILWDT